MPFIADELEIGRFFTKYLSEHFSYLDCMNLECVCSNLNGKWGRAEWDENEQKCRIKRTNSNGESTAAG
jgi:hypothetical protein